MELSSDNMEILQANENDLETLLDLQHFAFITEAENMNNFNIQPLTESLEELKLRFQNETIFKLVDNDKIIGSISAYCENKTCFIEKLFIHQDFRGNGYSNDLILYLFDYFSTYKIFEVFTNAESELNCYLYKKYGFKEYKREFIRGSEFVFFRKDL